MKKESVDKPLVMETLRLFYRVSARHRRDMYLSLLNPLSTVAFSVPVPYFAGQVFARILQPGASVTTPLVLLAVSSATGILLNRVGMTALMRLQTKCTSMLHLQAYEHLLKRGVGFHTNRISGKLVSDALDFTSSYNMLSNALFTSGIGLLGMLVVGIVVVLVNTWQLGVFLLATTAFILSWAYLESQKRSTLRARRLVANKKVTAHLSDTIVNAQTVKTFAQESSEIATCTSLNKTLRDLCLNDWQRAVRSGNNRIATVMLMQFIMLLLIVRLAQSDPRVIAAGIFAFTYTYTLMTRLFDINTLTRQVEEAFLRASPITATLSQTAEVLDMPNASKLNVASGSLAIKDVHFHYQESAEAQPVFSALNIDIKPGERVGLVGPSGGGKSTLTRLLLRFEDVDDGAIEIDGQNIAEVTQASLRHAIAYVPQEPLLFHRTIRENIAYGKLDAAEQKIIAAAKLAHAHEFIQKLPRGYDTIVGERGVKLSGGQRQRIAIARAILKNAPILILDEATSALDSESEVYIQEALWELMKDRTTIVIAHRLSTIQKMDRIIVLENGRITEEGPHKKLIKQNGTYAKLWSHQSGGFLENDEQEEE